MGPYKFVFQADAPDPRRIPTHDVLGVTVILLSCFYHEKVRAWARARSAHAARTQRARSAHAARTQRRTQRTRGTRRTRSACTPRARLACKRGAHRVRAARRTPRAGEVVRIGCACVTPLNPEPDPNREQEFIRIGYYVNTEYDAPERMEAPPEQIQVRVRVRVRVSSP